MVVDVRLFGVLLLLVVVVVVMAVGQFVVIVLVGMPVDPVLELITDQSTLMVVRDMIVIMRVCYGWVNVGGCIPIAFCVLLYHWDPLPVVQCRRSARYAHISGQERTVATNARFASSRY